MNNKQLSKEIEPIFSYMVDVLGTEFPTKMFSIEYFLLSLLECKKTQAYVILNSFLTSSALDELKDIYISFIRKNSTHVFYKNKEETIPFDENLQKLINAAYEETEKLNHSAVTSEDVLLSLLNPKNNFNDIINIFKNLGIDYNFIYNKCMDKNIKFNFDRKINKNNNFLMPLKSDVNPKAFNSKTPYIEQYTININKLSEQGEVDKLIGRNDEINKIIKVLARRKKNNVILVGKSGVGKTQIVKGIAQLINEQNVPEILQNKEIVMINITALISGTHFRGMFEERVNGLFEELKSSKKHILFIDDIQTVLKTSSKDRDTDISPMIGEILNEGTVRVIGTVNYKDYRTSIESNTSIARKLQKIIIEPTSKEETINIIMNNKEYYEKFHNVFYSEEIVKKCVDLSERYITERSLPDSAFDVIDLSGARTCIAKKENQEILELRKLISSINEEKNNALMNGDFEIVEDLEKREKEYKLSLSDLKRNIKNEIINITLDDITSSISEITNIPINKLQINEKEKIANIDNTLKQYIVGQDEAIEKVCRIIKRNKVGLGDKSKCRGALLLVGKTGCGKTFLAKKIAEEIYGSDKDLVRIDMSEYSESHSVSKLIGANPSYVGYENGGQLTEAIKHKPHCVLLLDEIEKANKEVYNIFLQLFDEGRLTDNSGQIVNFKNVLVIMTSNVGTKEATEMGNGIGFNGNTNNQQHIIDKQIKNKFTPEFLNRLDQIVYFNSLTDDNLKNVVKLELNKFIKRLNELNFNLIYSDEVINYLHDLSLKEKEYGARPIIRLIQHNIEDNITSLMLENEYENNYTFKAEMKNEQLVIA